MLVLSGEQFVEQTSTVIRHTELSYVTVQSYRLSPQAQISVINSLQENVFIAANSKQRFFRLCSWTELLGRETGWQ